MGLMMYFINISALWLSIEKHIGELHALTHPHAFAGQDSGVEKIENTSAADRESKGNSRCGRESMGQGQKNQFS